MEDDIKALKNSLDVFHLSSKQEEEPKESE